MSEKKKMKRPVRWILIAVVVLIIVVRIGSGGRSTTSGIASDPVPSRADYEGSVVLDYRSAMLEDYEEGMLVRVRGEGFQIIQDTNALLATDQGSFGYSGDNVLLRFRDEPRILEDDVIDVLGRYLGTRTYETTSGAEAEVPELIVDYFDALK